VIGVVLIEICHFAPLGVPARLEKVGA
jgi:hypothetical protein